MITNNFNLDSNLFNQNINNPIIEIETELKTDTHFFYSYIPNFKEKYVNGELEVLKNFLSQNVDSPDLPQIIKPTVVDIQHNYSDLNLKNKYGERIRFFDDGIITISHHKPKTSFDIALPRRSGNFLTDDAGDNDCSSFFDIVTVNGKSIYFSPDEVEKLYSMRKNLKLYIVCPEFSKTKALCIEIKNNKHTIDLLEYIHANYKTYFEKMALQVSYFYTKEMPGEYVEHVALETLGISRAMYNAQDYVKSYNVDSVRLRSVTGRPVLPTKKEILLMGFNQLVMQNLMTLAGYVIAFQKSKHKDKLLNLAKKDNVVAYEILKEIDKTNTVRDVCKMIVQSVFNKNLKPEEFSAVRQSLMHASTRAIDKNDYIHENKIVISFYYLWFLLCMTKKGTHLPFVGPINYHQMSEEAASLYWPSMNHTLLVSGWMEQINSFKYMNTLNFIKDYHEFSEDVHYTALKHAKEKIETLEGEPLEFVNKVIEEIDNTGTGEYIPYNAAYEIKDDPQFKYVRFIENERLIMFFVTDYNEQVLVDVYNKAKKQFCYWILNTQKLSEEQLRSFKNDLYPKVISAIRDWKVLIERDSSMTYRGKRVPKGVNSEVKRYIYLPRVRYKRDPKQVRHYYNENKILSGERRAHTRKLPAGAKPSKFQLLLAERNNIPVPPGHTFVKESLWGTGMTKKKYTYRTKSLHGMLYVDPNELHKVVKIDELSPAAFEEQMSKFMEKRGWEIVARNNYDGGIDIRGFKEFKDGVIKKLIVQCKHWKKAIGPDVIRELIGAKEVENDGYEKVMMVITSSRFTPGAIEIAHKHGVELIDGDILLNEME